MTLADELHIFEAAYNASMAEHGGTEPGAARLAGVAALAAALRRTLPGEAGRPTIQLQAREHVGCEWTDIYPAQLEWMSKERYDVRALEARSPSVNGAGGAITDEMLNAHLKATGAWVEPHEAETECGVAIECDLTQEDADQINSDQRDDLRTGYAAMLAAGPQGQSLADSSGPNPGAIGARKGADALTGVAPVASAPTNSADAPAGALREKICAIIFNTLGDYKAHGDFTTMLDSEGVRRTYYAGFDLTSLGNRIADDVAAALSAREE